MCFSREKNSENSLFVGPLHFDHFYIDIHKIYFVKLDMFLTSDMIDD